MRSMSLGTARELNSILRVNRSWANGKNFPVDHLHATVARSRWEYENINGIYLANEQHAWMALWMGLSNRNKLKKRHISYIRPKTSIDSIGQIALFATLPPEDNLCNMAYLYLIEPSKFCDREIVDIRSVPKPNKAKALLANGFIRKDIVRRGRKQPGIVDVTGVERVVFIDEWQIALTNFPDIVPDAELVIQHTAVTELTDRISILDSEVGEDYIQ